MRDYLGLSPRELSLIERAIAEYEQREGKTLYRLLEKGRPSVVRFFYNQVDVPPVWVRCYGIEALYKGLIKMESDPDDRMVVLTGFDSGERIKLTLFE